MTLSEYLSGIDRKQDFAKQIGVARQYMYRLANGMQQPSPALAMRIERETEGSVSKSELRPDIWPADSPAQSPEAA